MLPSLKSVPWMLLSDFLLGADVTLPTQWVTQVPNCRARRKHQGILKLIGVTFALLWCNMCWSCSVILGSRTWTLDVGPSSGARWSCQAVSTAALITTGTAVTTLVATEVAVGGLARLCYMGKHTAQGLRAPQKPGGVSPLAGKGRMSVRTIWILWLLFFC